MKHPGFKFGFLAVLCALLSISAVSAIVVPTDPLSSASPGSGAISVSSVNDNYPVSVDQAKDSIRLFVEDLSYNPVLWQTTSLPIGNYYVFSNEDSAFYVNQNSGVVEFAWFHKNAADSDVINLNRDQAYAKATEFAQKKYDGYGTTTWKLVTDKLGTVTNLRWNETSQQFESYVGKEYQFTLREEKDRVLTPNFIHVHINAATGMVSDWIGYNRLITVSLKPATTLSEATQVAEEYYSGYINVDHIDGYLAVVIRAQNVENLAWVVTVKGTYTGNNQYEDSEMLIVDAQTGKVIGNSWTDIWPESQIL